MGDKKFSDEEPVILRRTLLGKALLNDSLSVNDVHKAMKDHVLAGNSMDMRDSDTEETFLHLVASKWELYSRADKVGLVYLLCCKFGDPDARDCTGDTVLHKVVRQRGTYRIITCLMRNNADPMLKNREGKTAEEILRTEQPDGWEENLHWLQKFLPGLFHAVLMEEPDMQVVERLLKNWCQQRKIVNGKEQWLKCLADKKAGCSLRVITLLDKYENTVALALGAVCGKVACLRKWRLEGSMKDADINAKDSSYQYGYPDYPSSPCPLLALVWESNNFDMIEEIMQWGPDTSVPFRLEPEAHHRAKPLFFYVIDPKIGPSDERIVRLVLQNSDLDARNMLGQSVLFEAVQNVVSCDLFSFMLRIGCHLASRDRYGRTVRDYSIELGHVQYVALIDKHVTDMINDCDIDCLERLILKSYNHITDLDVVRKHRSKEHKHSRQLEELLTNANKKQERAKKMFEAVKSGSVCCSQKLLTKKYVMAQDRGGRTVLHLAVEHGHRKLVDMIVSKFPQIINVPNNMGQTPLHYAHLFMYTDDTADYLIQKGACTDMKDVEGWVPEDYVQKTIGPHAHEVMQQRVRDLELDFFLSDTNFDVAFLQAIRDGEKRRVEDLAVRLRDHGGMQRFKNVLFECLDHGHIDIACMLIRLGFSTEVYKQYEMCQPDDPMCAMMECSHAMMSFKQHAEELQAHRVLQLMADIASGKVKLKLRHCCLSRYIRPPLPAPNSSALR